MTERIYQTTKEGRGPRYVVSAMNEIGVDNHTVRVPILDYELLVTRDPRNVKAMLSTQVANYDISATRSNAFMPLLGEGIFTSRGAQWKHSRALVRPQFSYEQVSNLALMDRHAQILLNVLKVDESYWTPSMDVQPLFFHFTLDTATEYLYGQSVHSQSANAYPESYSSTIDGAAFSRNLDAAKHLVDKRGAVGKFYWLMPLKKIKGHCAELHKVVDNMIQVRLKAKKDPISTEEKGGNEFVLLDELAKEASNLLELRNETLHTLMAGRDPTGCLLAWTFYFLSRHAQIFQKLRSTILEEFGTSTTSTNIDFAKLRKCEYLQWVMNEVLRVVAVIPMNERVALRDTTLPRGGGPDGSHPVFVRKGIQILIPFYAIQHRPDLWGEDVEFFRPERWEGRKIGWEWTPFGGGPRKCLGRKFYYPFAPEFIREELC